MLVTNISCMSTKTERTRARILAAAIELSIRDGFDQVTASMIAAAAGVSQMTFFRYFPTKESVLTDDPYDPLIARAVAVQPRELTPLERARRGILQAWLQVPEPDNDGTRIRMGIAAANPTLRARMWENTTTTQEAIAHALQETGVEQLAARCAAAACMAVLHTGLIDWALDQDSTSTLSDRVHYSLDQLAITQS